MSDEKLPYKVTTLQIASVASYLSYESGKVLRSITKTGAPDNVASVELLERMETIIRTATNKMFEERSAGDMMREMMASILENIKEDKSTSQSLTPRKD